MSKKSISLIEVSLWLLALFMLLLVMSPYAMGWLVQKSYPQMLQNVAHSLQAKLNILQYQQGYFKSSIRYQIIFSEQRKLEFSEDIIHGPLYLGLINQSQSPFVAAVVQGKLLHGDVSDELKPWLKGSEFIYQHVMAYNGDANIQAYLPAHKRSQLSSAALHVDALYSSAQQNFSGVVKLPSFYMKTEEGQLTAKKVELSFMLLATEGLFLEGDGLLSLQYFEYQSKGQQWMLQNLIAQLQNDQQQDRLNLSAHINVSEAFASNERFGPMQLNLRLSSLDVTSVQHLWNDPHALFDANLDSTIAALLPVFFKGARFELTSLQLASDLGDLQGQFLLSSNTQESMAAADPLSLLNALNLSLSLNVDKLLMQQIVAWQLQAHADDGGLVETIKPALLKQQVKQNLQGLVAGNWLSFDQQAYRCQLELSQGQAQLNQQAVDPLAHIMSQIQSSTAVQ